MKKKHGWRRFGTRGVLAFGCFYLLKKLGFNIKNPLIPIRLQGFKDFFYARFGTSDRAVFNQIFIEQEYACLNHVKDPKLIMDCGANVGYSSLWFLNRYPGAHMIAIEPDAGNFKLGADFFHDQKSGAVNGADGHGREQERNSAADQ